MRYSRTRRRRPRVRRRPGSTSRPSHRTATGGTSRSLTERCMCSANAPLQAVRDRFGNTLTIAHDNGQAGNVTRVTSPSGRWVSFAYNPANQVTRATGSRRPVRNVYLRRQWQPLDSHRPRKMASRRTPTLHRTELATIRDGRNIVYVDEQVPRMAASPGRRSRSQM